MSDLFIPMAVLIALVIKITDLLKYARNKDVNGVTTILFVWIAGFVGVWLFANSAWSDGLVFGEKNLGSLNIASQILIGFAVGSSAGTVFDFKKALDGSDSAAVPSLIPDPPPANRVNEVPDGR